MMKSTMKVVGYVRVSSDRQAETQLSLDAQRQQIVSYCLASNLQIIDIYCDEGVSGGKDETQREGLQQVLAAITEGRAEAVAVAKRDRLSRAVSLSGYIETTIKRAGGEVIILDEIDVTPLTRCVMLMIAEVERLLASQRTKLALRQLKERGCHVGAVPYGFEIGDDGKLQPKAGEYEIVQQVVAMRRDGATLKEIAEWLTASGIQTKRGGRWSAEQVRSMLLQAERQGVEPSKTAA